MAKSTFGSKPTHTTTLSTEIYQRKEAFKKIQRYFIYSSKILSSIQYQKYTHTHRQSEHVPGTVVYLYMEKEKLTKWNFQ